MRIGEIYRRGSFGLSIEIFPPKTPEADESLRRTLDRLVPFRPAFVSCTYGAGGTTRDRTLDWCEEIQTRWQVPATAHFTCVGSSREDLHAWLAEARRRGVRNIMALRGDIPQGETEFRAAPGGLRHANELVALIRGEYPDMGIGVAGYPEKHVEAPDLDTDLAHLKRKVDAGADAVFTQLFFANAAFLSFRDRCERAGIRVPVVPGIMPVTEFARIRRITAMCGAHFPADLAAKLEAVQDDKEAQAEIGTDHAIAQCRALVAAGVPGLHLYALNRSPACERILEALGMTAATAGEGRDAR